MRFLRCGRKCGAPDGRGERPDALSIIGEGFFLGDWWSVSPSAKDEFRRLILSLRSLTRSDCFSSLLSRLYIFLLFVLSFSLSFFLLTSYADKSYEADSVTEWGLWLANWGEGWRGGDEGK